MTSRLTLVTALALVLTAPTVLAQGTDFTGTWELDQDASAFPDFGGGRGGRRGGFGGRGGGPAMGAGLTLIITQTDSRLTVEQQSDRGSRTLTYHLDGTESTNSGPRGEQTTTSQWDGESLVSEGTMEMSTPRGDFSMEFVERRTLSDDGQTMTVKATRVTPRGDITTTLVYTKSL